MWIRKLQKALEERTNELIKKNNQLDQMEQQNTLMVEEALKLKELDRQKSRYFAYISHEFRTPLTLIMGTLENIRYVNRDSEIEQSIKGIIRNTQQVLALINQLLDLAKLDSGKMRLNSSRQNIVPFIRGIVESFHFFALQHNQQISYHVDEENIILYFDTEKLEKIIINLISNALKFTSKGGTISITVNRCPKDKHVQISVIDTGIGIPNDHLPHIFDRYTQVGSTDRLDYEKKGTGLGLALVKELVSLHSGIIDVHSTVLKGTEFVIKLPLEEIYSNETEKIPIPINTNGAVLKTQNTENVSQMTQIQTPLVQKESSQHRYNIHSVTEKKKKEKDLILLVEDSLEMREFLRKPFENQYNIIEASNGREGMEKARGYNPDLIISDIMMPEIDGYELCRGLKKDLRTSQIPIILLTAKASEESIKHGLETMADDYVTKPFNTKLLSLRMQNLIYTRRELKKSFLHQTQVQPDEVNIKSMDDEFIADVRKILEQNLSDPNFNVEKLAKKLIISRSGLYKRIHTLLNESPVEYIRNYRLERARQLLKKNYGNITEVAQEVGFANVAYFTKCYKKCFNHLPSEHI